MLYVGDRVCRWGAEKRRRPWQRNMGWEMHQDGSTLQRCRNSAKEFLTERDYTKNFCLTQDQNLPVTLARPLWLGRLATNFPGHVVLHLPHTGYHWIALRFEYRQTVRSTSHLCVPHFIHINSGDQILIDALQK